MLLLLVFIVLKSWLLAVNLLVSLMLHWKTHPLDESEGGGLRKANRMYVKSGQG